MKTFRSLKSITEECFNHLKQFGPSAITNKSIQHYVKQKYDIELSRQLLNAYLGSYVERCHSFYDKSVIDLANLIIEECDNDLTLAKAILSQCFYNSFKQESK